MKILQVSCSYFPNKIGGTEGYVHNLSQELTKRGHKVFINYIDVFCEENGPEIKTKEYAFEGLPVFVIEKNVFSLKTAELYFNYSESSQVSFTDYLKKIQPDIVHFHHLSPTDVTMQMQAAKKMRLPIIFTYHTPMMTCAHTDMLYLGKKVCDGKLEYKKCLACAQTKYNIPFLLAWLWAGIPESMAKSLGAAISKSNFKGRLATWLQMPWLTRERMNRWRMLFNLIDRFVVLSQWSSEVLVKNGIAPEKITLCRQGIIKPCATNGTACGRPSDAGGEAGRSIPDAGLNKEVTSIMRKPKDNTHKLRLGYLGRIHPVKGLDVLLKAFKLLPLHLPIELYIYGDGGQDDAVYYRRLLWQSHRDKRINWMGLLSEEEKFTALVKLDALVIPSRWLETGPLVLLEAWAAGLPVIGARSGGILELVAQDCGGLLFRPQDARDLAGLILRVIKYPDALEKLKEAIPRLRTIDEVTTEMEELYQGVRLRDL